MTIIIAAMQDSLLSIESSKTGWKTHESLRRTHPQCLAFDTWNRIGNDQISSNEVTSISVNRLEACVYVGTEPSALYRSDDEGESWQRLSALNNLGSSKSWSFPPRPWTSHVRW